MRLSMRAFRRGALLLCLAGGLAIGGTGAVQVAVGEDAKPNASVTIDQVQVAFIFSGNVGGGVLTFEGKTYDFSIGGLGIGGFGASSIHAYGEVYNLKSVADFAGAYGQARTGIAAGTVGGGELWLENAQGVYMKLKSERKGLALSLGADAVYISF